VPGVDFDRLARWMDGKGLGSGPIEDVRLISGGTQNICCDFAVTPATLCCVGPRSTSEVIRTSRCAGKRGCLVP